MVSGSDKTHNVINAKTELWVGSRGGGSGASDDGGGSEGAGAES